MVSNPLITWRLDGLKVGLKVAVPPTLWTQAKPSLDAWYIFPLRGYFRLPQEVGVICFLREIHHLSIGLQSSNYGIELLFRGSLAGKQQGLNMKTVLDRLLMNNLAVMGCSMRRTLLIRLF